MAILNPKVVGNSVRFDGEEAAEAGRRLSEQYIGAEPYDHIVLDDFLPHEVLERVVAEFPDRASPRFDNAQSRLKTGYKLEMIESAFINNLLWAFNSAEFIRFLEGLSGIGSLLSDPLYEGGGLHETARGGHLSIHADFNLHVHYMLLRRMNVILFLNENWLEEYGGQLELWTTDMKHKAKSVVPSIGRVVIFNTNADSFHGHPDPLDCPEDRYRRSLALYYFTLPETTTKIPRRTTQFQVRPSSEDRRDWSTWRRELFRDLCPPMIWRKLHKGD